MSSSRKPPQKDDADDLWSKLLLDEEKPSKNSKPTVRVTGPDGPKQTGASLPLPPPPQPAEPVAVLHHRVVVAEEEPDDGRIHYTCMIPAGMGVVMGGIGGAVLNAVSGMSKGRGAMQGAAFLATNGAVSCILLKQQNATVYDKNYNRAISMAAAGSMWPVAGQAYNAIKRMPILPPAIGIQRSLLAAVGCGLVGFAMDHFDLARPTKHEDDKPTPPVIE